MSRLVARLIVATTALCLAMPAAAGVERIGEAALRRHIAVLASDAMEGRAPGTPGGDRAIAYIARQFAAAGLAPAGGKGWHRPVPLLERRALTASLSVRGKSEDVALDPADMTLLGRDRDVTLTDARVVFAGYGTEAETAGCNVAGAVVLVLTGRSPSRAVPSLDVRRAALLARGAAAVIVAGRVGDTREAVRRSSAARTLPPATAMPLVSGAIAYPSWSRLVTAAGEDSAALAAAADRADFRARRIAATATLAVTTAMRAYRSWNVVGRIAGQGGDGRSVFVLAHWDHLGLCRPEGARDRICNGAVDNASGVAALIEIAGALAAASPPRRDLYFVATAAEEMGLLGAKALAADPPVALDSIAAVLNLDTIALAPRGAALSVIGRGGALDPLIDATARSVGRRVDPTARVNALAERQDGWAFAQLGIPAAMIGGAFTDQRRLDRFFAGRYHRPDDELAARLELGGAAEDATFHVALLRALADPDRFAVTR